MNLFLSIVLWLLVGMITAYFANQRGRDPIIWFMIGMFFGIIGLLVLFLLPQVDSKEQSSLPVENAPLELAQLPVKNHEFAIKDWYYLDEERQQRGPVGFDYLKKIWNEGKLSSDSFIWSEGMETWKKIKEMHDVMQEMQLSEWRDALGK